LDQAGGCISQAAANDLTRLKACVVSQRRFREPGDFGLAVHDRFEHHPKPAADLGAQHGLVEVAEGLLILLQPLRI
jgi:hypothetical protein